MENHENFRKNNVELKSGNVIKSSVISPSTIHSAKTYTHLDKKKDAHILHQDTTKIKTKVPDKSHSPIQNEWSTFNHKDWYCQGLAKRVFSAEIRHDLEKNFGSNVTNMIYQCIGSKIALSNNNEEYHKEINDYLNDSISSYNNTYGNIKVSKNNDNFSFQIDNYSINIVINDRVSIKTNDNKQFCSNSIESIHNVVEPNPPKKKDNINSDIYYKDISSIKHDDWLYIRVTKNLYSNYDISRLKTVLDANQLDYLYEYVGTQKLLNQSRQILNNNELNQHTYDIVEKNISHLENHLYGLSQRASDYDKLEFKISDDYQIKSLATSSHFVDLSKGNNTLSIKRKFGSKIDKLEYKPLIGDLFQDTMKTVSMNTTQEDDSVSNTTVGMVVSVKDVPSNVVEVKNKISDFSNSLEEHIKGDYSTFKSSKSVRDGIENVIKDNVKTGVNKGIHTIRDSPKKIATSMGRKILQTNPNVATSTDTGIDGIKTGVSGVRTAIDTKRTVDNTVVAGKKFIKSVKNTPKAIAKDLKKIKKIVDKLKVIITTVKGSSLGIVAIVGAFFLMIILVIFGGAVSGVTSSMSSLFGWLYDEDNKSKVSLEVLYDDWEYIAELLNEVQSTYDTTLNNPESINSNWKNSFERLDSERHLYGYQDTIMGEKFNYKEISLNVLSALAIDRYSQLVASSGSTTGTVTQAATLVTNSSGQISLEFTEKEIKDKLELFYETEYTPTTFYCDNSVLNIGNAYEECKSYDYFSNVFNTTDEKSFIYGGNYDKNTGRIRMYIEGNTDEENIYFNPTYYEIWATQDFLLHELNGEGFVYSNGTHAYVIGEAPFSDGSSIYCVRFSSVEDGNYPSYDDIHFLYSSDGMSYNYGGDIQVLDVDCNGHQEISCYIATKIKDKITAQDLGLNDEEYELFLVVKEELQKLIDAD